MELSQAVITVIESIFSLLESAFWPLTILLVVYLFRRNVAGLIDRITSFEATAPGTSIAARTTWQDEAVSGQPADGIAPESAAVARDYQWEHVADLFWAGYTLMYAIHYLDAHGAKLQIIEGLDQTITSMERLGFEDTPAHKQVVRARKAVAILGPEAEMDPEFRTKLVAALQSAGQYIGREAARYQGEFVAAASS
ncbi:MAG: hypothetical protein R3300_08085 [Candidatus Promineifilaceae bacterium]|nr:hypothetical protein [Candidatus Promineifilaceae bacterium]